MRYCQCFVEQASLFIYVRGIHVIRLRIACPLWDQNKEMKKFRTWFKKLCEIFSGPWKTSIQKERARDRRPKTQYRTFLALFTCIIRSFAFDRFCLPLNWYAIAGLVRWLAFLDKIHFLVKNLACFSSKTPPQFFLSPSLALLQNWRE